MAAPITPALPDGRIRCEFSCDQPASFSNATPSIEIDYSAMGIPAGQRPDEVALVCLARAVAANPVYGQVFVVEFRRGTEHQHATITAVPPPEPNGSILMQPIVRYRNSLMGDHRGLGTW